MTKAELMQSCWEMSEKSTDKRDQLLLEIAGNLIESTFLCASTNTDGIIKDCIKDAKEHLDG